MSSPDRKIKIMLCDDHSLFRTGVRTSLAEKEEIEIIGEAENGQILLSMLETSSPDIVIMNISMPVLDGMQTLPLIKKRYPHIKVMILSMHSDRSVICKMLELGANAYLTKESGSAEIYKSILACHEKWFYINRLVVEAMAKILDPDPPIVIGKNLITEKEQKILYLVMQEKETKEIGDSVGLSPRTIEAIIDKLKTKFDVKSRAGLIMAAIKTGAISEQ